MVTTGKPVENPVESLQKVAEPLQKTPAEALKNPLRSFVARYSAILRYYSCYTPL